MITTSEVAVSVTVDNNTNLDDIIKELQPLGSVDIDADQTIISIVGSKLNDVNDLLKQVFTATDGIPVRMVSYGGSTHNISLLVPSAYKKNVLQAINKEVFQLL